MNDFTPVSAAVGGMLIGLAASIFLVAHGRVAGISGLYGSLFRRHAGDRGLRIAFVSGLVVTGVIVGLVAPGVLTTTWHAEWPLVLVAGVLVGFGTQLGGGCTSGHGVCGMSRLSGRSLVATPVFMASAFATVFVVRHLLGSGR